MVNNIPPANIDPQELLKLVDEYSARIGKQHRNWITAQLIKSLFSGNVDWSVLNNNIMQAPTSASTPAPTATAIMQAGASQLFAKPLSAGNVDWRIMLTAKPRTLKNVRHRFKKTLPEDAVDKNLVSQCELDDDLLCAEIAHQRNVLGMRAPAQKRRRTA